MAWAITEVKTQVLEGFGIASKEILANCGTPQVVEAVHCLQWGWSAAESSDGKNTLRIFSISLTCLPQWKQRQRLLDCLDNKSVKLCVEFWDSTSGLLYQDSGSHFLRKAMLGCWREKTSNQVKGQTQEEQWVFVLVMVVSL